MSKKEEKQVKNKSMVQRLFDRDGSDSFYMEIKRDEQPWHSAAKLYWQELYEKHRFYLDKGFSKKLSHACLDHLWELAQVDFIAQHKSLGIELVRLSGQASKPDFCFIFEGKRFYYETVGASPGNNRELNVTLAEVSGKARSTPIVENMERLCGVIREKAHTKYYGEESCGYKCYMSEDSGLVIAISMTKIPFHNQANNFHVDLRCIFGMSPMKIPLVSTQQGHYEMGGPYYEHQPAFNKANKDEREGSSKIKMDYFATDEFSHVSAILLSHNGLSLFPDIDRFVNYCHWKKHRNDYTLVHNPFAKVSLPVGFFQVSREVVATAEGLKIIEDY